MQCLSPCICHYASRYIQLIGWGGWFPRILLPCSASTPHNSIWILPLPHRAGVVYARADVSIPSIAAASAAWPAVTVAGVPAFAAFCFALCMWLDSAHHAADAARLPDPEYFRPSPFSVCSLFYDFVPATSSCSAAPSLCGG